MTNITITLTEAQVEALRRGLHDFTQNAHSNMEMDAQNGNTQFADAHTEIDIILGKIDDQEWIEEWVSGGAAVRPDLSKAVIRKYAKQALKDEKEG